MNSIYINKRNAFASPAKGGANISKDIVNLTGYARGTVQIQPVDPIDSKFLPQLATIIPNSSGPARGAAQMLQANPINYRSWFNSAIKIHNSSILAGEADQISEPNAINDKSQLSSAINIHIPSIHTGGAAQNSQTHAMVDNLWSLIVGAAMKVHNSPDLCWRRWPISRTKCN